MSEMQDEGLSLAKWQTLAIAATIVSVLMTGIVIGKSSAPAWGGDRTFTIRLEGGKPRPLPADPAGQAEPVTVEPVGGELAP